MIYYQWGNKLNNKNKWEFNGIKIVSEKYDAELYAEKIIKEIDEIIRSKEFCLNGSASPLAAINSVSG